MIVCLQVLLALLVSWADAGVITTPPPPAVDEDPVSNARSAGEPVNINHVGGMHMPGFVPLPGFAPLIHGGPPVYGAQQQLGPGAYGGYGAHQPVDGAPQHKVGFHSLWSQKKTFVKRIEI